MVAARLWRTAPVPGRDRYLSPMEKQRSRNCAPSASGASPCPNRCTLRSTGSRSASGVETGFLRTGSPRSGTRTKRNGFLTSPKTPILTHSASGVRSKHLTITFTSWLTGAAFCCGRTLPICRLKPDDISRAICRQEAAHMIRRLAHHPSILMWCGGNEAAMWNESEFGGPGVSGPGAYPLSRMSKRSAMRWTRSGSTCPTRPTTALTPMIPSSGTRTAIPTCGTCRDTTTWSLPARTRASLRRRCAA